MSARAWAMVALRQYRN